MLYRISTLAMLASAKTSDPVRFLAPNRQLDEASEEDLQSWREGTWKEMDCDSVKGALYLKDCDDKEYFTTICFDAPQDGAANYCSTMALENMGMPNVCYFEFDWVDDNYDNNGSRVPTVELHGGDYCTGSYAVADPNTSEGPSQNNLGESGHPLTQMPLKSIRASYMNREDMGDNLRLHAGIGLKLTIFPAENMTPYDQVSCADGWDTDPFGQGGNILKCGDEDGLNGWWCGDDYITGTLNGCVSGIDRIYEIQPTSGPYGESGDDNLIASSQIQDTPILNENGEGSGIDFASNNHGGDGGDWADFQGVWSNNGYPVGSIALGPYFSDHSDGVSNQATWSDQWGSGIDKFREVTEEGDFNNVLTSIDDSQYCDTDRNQHCVVMRGSSQVDTTQAFSDWDWEIRIPMAELCQKGRSGSVMCWNTRDPGAASAAGVSCEGQFFCNVNSQVAQDNYNCDGDDHNAVVQQWPLKYMSHNLRVFDMEQTGDFNNDGTEVSFGEAACGSDEERASCNCDFNKYFW